MTFASQSTMPKLPGIKKLSAIGLLLAASVSASVAGAKVEFGSQDDFNSQGLPAAVAERELTGAPSQGLRYLLSKMNQFKAKRDTAVNLRFGLSFEKKAAEPFAIEPQLTNDGQLILDLKIDESLKENRAAIFEAITMLKAIAPRDGNLLSIVTPKGPQDALEYLGAPSGSLIPNVTHPLEWLELKINEAGGSALAKRELLQAELALAVSAPDAFMSSRLAFGDELEIKNEILALAEKRGLSVARDLSAAQTWRAYREKRAEEIHKALKQAVRFAKNELREMRAERENPAREAKKRALETAPEKLEALVKKNDRAGVADLLEAYLPWEQFSPVETAFWKRWLESIRRPDFSKAKVLFRGIDEKDRVQVARDANGAETGYGFFPTLLTRNQGNYTRRLRSYETMRLKFGSHIGKVSPLVAMPKMASMMFNHAESPHGSPFLSFTTSAALAKGYADAGNIAVVQIDPRRFLPNLISPFKSEAEFLVPMVVFPDEVLFYPNRSRKSEAAPSLQAFIAEAKAKAGITISQTPETDLEVFAGTFRAYGEIKRTVERPQRCRAAFSATVKRMEGPAQ